VQAQSFAKAIRTDMMSLSHSGGDPQAAYVLQKRCCPCALKVQNKALNSTAMDRLIVQ
jgi:hypothetical protein